MSKTLFVELSDEIVEMLAKYAMYNEAVPTACKIALQQDQKWWKEKIAFAEGKVIQFKYGDSWLSINPTDGCPRWDIEAYRIELDPKPDVVKYRVMQTDRTWSDYDCEQSEHSNMALQTRILLDGETGAIKTVEKVG